MDNNLVICKYCNRQYSTKGIGTHIWRTHGEGRSFNPNSGYSKGTRVAWNKGLTKETSKSVASMSDKLTRKRSELELLIDDDKKLYSKWYNKKINAKAENIEFNLTFEDYIQLVADANLKSSQLGFTGEGYVLARIADIGPYTIGNCRFILQSENAKERKVSEKSIAASRENIKRASEVLSQDPLRSQKISYGIKNSDYYKNRLIQSAIRKAEYDARKDKRYSGEHNSQTGSFWITDGIINKKWRETMGELPQGFYRGRKI